MPVSTSRESNDRSARSRPNLQQETPTFERPEDQIAGTTPSWFVGLVVQLALAVGLMAWGIARTRTPAKRLPRGTRIA